MAAHGSVRDRHRATLLAALLVSAGAAACSGVIGDPIAGREGAADGTDAVPTGSGPARDPGAPAVPPGKGPTSDPNCAKIHPGASPMRRLTNEELDYALLDLFEDDTHPGQAFPADGEANGFDNAAAASTVSQLYVERLQDAAEAAAKRATQLKMATVLGSCDPAKQGEATCTKQLVAGVGRRIFRRPLTADEASTLSKVVDAGKQSDSYATGVRLALTVMLQSPQFLYRLELAPPKDGETVKRVTGAEMASRLSFLLWSSIPDAELDAAVDAGKLETAEQIAAQATRMMKDEKSRRTVARFYGQWLELARLGSLAKDPMLYPAYDDALKTSMQEETRRFVEHVFFDGDHRFETMLTAPYSFVDAPLAKLYGVTAPATPFAKTALDPARRSGLLTHGSLLASHAKYDVSSPVQRGKFVRERLLCEVLPPPPPGVEATPPKVGPDATTRERFEQHDKDPACAGCHVRMDPIGFGFEHFDAIGAWRDTEKGKPIDATAKVIGGGDAEGSFGTIAELGARLAKSETVQRCVSVQWFRYASGRGEGDEDACSLALTQQRFTATKGDLVELVIGLTQTDAFLYRTVEAP